jgi:hypothetical protein
MGDYHISRRRRAFNVRRTASCDGDGRAVAVTRIVSIVLGLESRRYFAMSTLTVAPVD